jgi:hypothetical protein
MPCFVCVNHTYLQNSLLCIHVYIPDQLTQSTANQHQAFTSVLEMRAAIIRRHAPLYLSTYFFDYLGAVVNYAGT